MEEEVRSRMLDHSVIILCMVAKTCKCCFPRWLYAESERQRLTALCAEKDNELSAKEYKIRQARRLLEDERRVRIAAEADREAFARQV